MPAYPFIRRKAFAIAVSRPSRYSSNQKCTGGRVMSVRYPRLKPVGLQVG